MSEVTLYNGDCLEIMPTLSDVSSVVTDPPYPNNAGHFIEAIDVARTFLQTFQCPSWFVFWSELEQPPVHLPLVAVHIWHRTNVNGRPYEPIYQFNADGRKRRSEVFQQAAIFDGAGPGCHEYAGHPTQKPVALMRRLLQKCSPGRILDPFMGSGSTGLACIKENRNFVGIERDENYFCIAQKRINDASKQGILDIFSEKSTT